MSFFEAFLKFKGFPMQQAGEKLHSIQKLDADSLHQWQTMQKWEIVHYHAKNNPVYRELLKGKIPEKWEELPVLKKSHYQKDIAEMISDEFKISDVYIENTSGSSGHPFFYAKDKFAHAITWQLILSRYREAGISLSSKQARFYGIPLSFTGYWKETIKDRILNRRRFPVFDLSDQNLEKYTSRFRNGNFAYVYGYTNSIVLFAKYLLKSNVVLKEICHSLKLCIVTSEMCTDEDKILIEKAMGIPVIREYGASEIDMLAFENKKGDWILSEENVFFEVVDENNLPLPNGQEGKLLVTSLNNKAMPFIRYEIGDQGIIAQGPDGKMLLKKLSGRINDTIVLPSGKKSPGLTFYYISRSILESSGVLKEFIIRQTALDQFVFEIVTDEDLSQEQIKGIKSKMDLYLEPGLKLEIKRMDKIERPVSGKIKHFYSEIKN